MLRPFLKVQVGQYLQQAVNTHRKSHEFLHKDLQYDYRLELENLIIYE